MTDLLAKHPNGIYLSGALLMFAGSKSYYLYGASSNDYRDFLPNHHMQYEMMKFAREHGAKHTILVELIIIQIKTLNTTVYGRLNVSGALI